jgi:hypothetical protein
LPVLYEPIKRLGLGWIVFSATPLDDLEHTRWEPEELEAWHKDINKFYNFDENEEDV